MRTTLTLDDSIDQQIRLLAATSRVSYREMVNRTLKSGLEVQKIRGGSRSPFRVKAHRCGFRPGIDLEKLNQLVDDLDVEDVGHEASS